MCDLKEMIRELGGGVRFARLRTGNDLETWVEWTQGLFHVIVSMLVVDR